MTTALATMSRDELLHRLENLETQLASLRRELEHLGRLATVGEISAGVAHEINNVLTPAFAYVQLAQADEANEKLRTTAINRAATSMDAASQIASAVLALAHPGNDAAACNVEESVRRALECLPRDPRRDGITIESQIDPTANACIAPLALQQVMLNLLLNATRAIRSGGGGRIVIQSSRAGDNVRIAVADDGPGIPAGEEAHIFDPFVSHAQNGSGLGLAICKRTLESANGTISVSQTHGGGATFTVDLRAAA